MCLATLHLIVVDKSRACQHNRTLPPDTSWNAIDSPWMLKRRARNQAHLMQAILLHATYPAPFSFLTFAAAIVRPLPVFVSFPIWLLEKVGGARYRVWSAATPYM